MSAMPTIFLPSFFIITFFFSLDHMENLEPMKREKMPLIRATMAAHVICSDQRLNQESYAKILQHINCHINTSLTPLTV